MHFIIVYSTEAHPRASADPATYEERVALAITCGEEDGINVPVLVDEMDNRVWCTYGAQPNNAYFIGKDAKVIARQSWYIPQTMEKAIVSYLNGGN